MLNLTTLQNSIQALENAVEVISAAPAGADNAYGPKVMETLKSGVIQNFEVAYEQSWKMLQRCASSAGYCTALFNCRETIAAGLGGAQ